VGVVSPDGRGLVRGLPQAAAVSVMMMMVVVVMVVVEPVRDTDTATFYTFRPSRHRHIHLELRAGLERRQLRDRVVLEMCCLAGRGGSRSSAWKSHPSLSVQSVCVRCAAGGGAGGDAQPVPFQTQPFSSYGESLVLSLDSRSRQGEQLDLGIHYMATDGPGVVWLEPEQTAGKNK